MWRLVQLLLLLPRRDCKNDFANLVTRGRHIRETLAYLGIRGGLLEIGIFGNSAVLKAVGANRKRSNGEIYHSTTKNKTAFFIFFTNANKI